MFIVYYRNCPSPTFYIMQFFQRPTGISLFFYLPLRQFDTRLFSLESRESRLRSTFKLGQRQSVSQIGRCLISSLFLFNLRIFIDWSRAVVRVTPNSRSKFHTIFGDKFSYKSLFDQSVNSGCQHFISWSTIQKFFFLIQSPNFLCNIPMFDKFFWSPFFQNTGFIEETFVMK